MDKIERWLLYAMVVTIPVNGLPKAYPIPDFMKNVPCFFFDLVVFAGCGALCIKKGRV